MTDMALMIEDFATRKESRRTRCSNKLACLKCTTIPALHAAGIATVEITFDGYGDSGAVEGIDCRDADGTLVECPDVEIAKADDEAGGNAGPSVTALSATLEDLAYLALELHHPGWEINEGSSGSLEIDVEKNAFTLECRTRFIDYNQHTTDI